MRFAVPALSAVAFAALSLASTAQAAAFGAGDLVIYRVGTGSSALSSAATQVYLDEYSASGTLVQSLAVSGLTSSGSATSEGLITRSVDGRTLDFTGYNAALGTSKVASSTTASREIGQADAQGNISIASVLDSYGGNNIRSAVSVNGSSFFTGGPDATTGGARYVVGNTSTGIATGANTRQVNIFNNQLYYSTGSGTAGIYALGSGLPTGTATGSLIAKSSSPYAFYFADLNSSVAGVDTLYVADDSVGIEKFSLAGGTWSLTGTISASNVRGLTGVVTSSGVQLYATSDSTLYSVLDNSGYDQTLNGTLTTLATATTDEAFRGLALAPTAAVPEPETDALLLAGLGCLGYLNVRSRRQRQR